MKICKFISLVKERPVLYDSLNPLYKIKKEKDRMWREISAAVNIHSDIAKSRWKSLKDCYTKHLKSTMATGPAAYLKYINWQWAEHMSFMKPHLKFGLILSNIELKDIQETDDLVAQSSSDIQGYQSDSEILKKRERYETPERFATPDNSEMYKISDADEMADTHEKSATHETIKIQEKPKKHERTYEKIRRRRRIPMFSPDISSPPNIERNIQYLKKKNTDSYTATELIFLGYAKSVKTLSIRRQAQVKMKIAKIMMEEEIAHFEETMTCNEYQGP